MTLEQICEFVTLAEQRNYLIAADIMFMTQATLSRHIMALEEELGYALFDRTTKRIELTTEGTRFLVFARDIERLKNSYTDAIKKIKKANEGQLRVGYNYLISIYDGNIILNNFVNDNPNFKIVVSEGEPKDLIQMVKDGILDVAIFQEDPFNRVYGIDTIRLHSDTLCVIASHKGKYSKIKKCSLLNFKDDDFVTSDPDRQPVSPMFEACRRSGYEPKISKTGFIGNLVFNWIDKHPEYLALEWKCPATYVKRDDFNIIDIEPPLNYHTVLIYNKETISNLGKQLIKHMQKNMRSN